MSTPSLKSVISWLKSGATSAVPQDCRGHRFVAVIDCVLNQNVCDQGAATFSAMNFDLLQICHEQVVGVMQMPCPEIAALGFRRERAAGTTLRQALDTEAGRQSCVDLAVAVAERIQAALAGGSRLMAVLGDNPLSPGCAVHHDALGLTAEAGVFMQALQQELRQRDINVPFKGIRDASPEMLAEDLRWFRDLLGGPPL